MPEIRPQWRPLQPVAAVVGVLLTLMVLTLGLSLFTRQALWGNGRVCTSIPILDLPMKPSWTRGVVAVGGLARGSRATTPTVTLCANNPASSLRLAGQLATWPLVLLWLGFLLRARRLLRAASQPGRLYSRDTAGRLRSLGWFLIVGSVIAGMMETAANIMILLSQVHYPGFGWFQPSQINMRSAPSL